MRDNTCICCGRIIPEGRQICLHCGDYDDMQTFKPSLRANYPEPYVPPKKTNGDRIRAMSNEELAQFLCRIGDCKTCPFSSIQCNIRGWLEREAKMKRDAARLGKKPKTPKDQTKGRSKKQGIE